MIKITVLFVTILIISPLNLKSQQLPQQYREAFSNSFPIRKDQHLELKAYVDQILMEKTEEALALFQPDFFSIEDYKSSLYPYRKKMGDHFGYPPPKSIDGKITKFEKAGEDIHCTLYRVWVEVIEGVNAYGILMVPKNVKEKIPLLIAQHGGSGNPEAICDLDTRINYHSFGPEAVKRGYAVWAPALAMHCSYCKDSLMIPGANRDEIDRKLKLAGTSIIGVEIHKIIESTRTLIKERPEIDAERIGMTGLSWGGFYTLYATALCPFIKAAAPSAQFREYESELKRAVTDKSSRVPDRYSFDGIGIFQAVGLICPRPCMIQLGEKDELFNLEEAKKESAKAEQFYEKLGIANLYEFSVHPGGHEYDTPAILNFFDKYLK